MYTISITEKNKDPFLIYPFSWFLMDLTRYMAAMDITAAANRLFKPITVYLQPASGI